MPNLIERDKKKRNVYLKYELKRLQYKSIINDLSLPKEIRYTSQLLLNTLPRNSSQIRIRNRCVLTGRGHSILRNFRMSRIKLRELASQGLLLGVTKSSW